MANMNEICKQLLEVKAKHEAASDALKQINLEWSAIESTLIEAMAEEGVASVKLADGTLLSLTTKNRLSVTQANMELFIPYLKEHGHGGLLKEYVAPQTLTAFLKTHLQEIKQRFIDGGQDEFDAAKEALEVLKCNGVSYFSEKTIAIRGGK